MMDFSVSPRPLADLYCLKMVYVRDERIECVITLANPLSFEIELQDLTLA